MDVRFSTEQFEGGKQGVSSPKDRTKPNICETWKRFPASKLAARIWEDETSGMRVSFLWHIPTCECAGRRTIKRVAQGSMKEAGAVAEPQQPPWQRLLRAKSTR